MALKRKPFVIQKIHDQPVMPSSIRPIAFSQTPRLLKPNLFIGADGPFIKGIYMETDAVKIQLLKAIFPLTASKAY